MGTVMTALLVAGTILAVGFGLTDPAAAQLGAAIFNLRLS